MEVDQLPGRASDTVLGNTDVKVVIPQCFCNRLRLGDIYRELCDHVPVRIVGMPVGAPVRNRNDVRKYPVLVQGFDKFDGFCRFGEDETIGVFTTDFTNLDLKAELLSFRPVFDMACEIRCNPDILGEFLPDVLSLEVEDVGSIDGKGGVTGIHLGIDQLFCPVNFSCISCLDGDMIGVQCPGAELHSACRLLHLCRKNRRRHTGVTAFQVALGPGKLHEHHRICILCSLEDSLCHGRDPDVRCHDDSFVAGDPFQDSRAGDWAIGSACHSIITPHRCILILHA